MSIEQFLTYCEKPVVIMWDLWYGDCRAFLTSAHLLLRPREQNREREVNPPPPQKKKEGMGYFTFSCKNKEEEKSKRKKKRKVKGEQSYICLVLSPIPSTYIISVLKWALNVLVVFPVLLWKGRNDFNWIQYDLPSSSYAKALFFFFLHHAKFAVTSKY